MRFHPTASSLAALLLTSLVVAGCGGQSISAEDVPSTPDAGTPGAEASTIAPASDAAPSTVDADTTVPATTPAMGQRFLFEMSYVNYAWGHQLSGVFINVHGEVYTYDNSAVDPSAPAPFEDLVPGMTEAQVTGKFGSGTYLTTIDPGTLSEKFGLVGAARQGALLRTSNCADYGEARFVAYLYDPSTALYTPVPLGTDGDLSVRNTAEAANVLLEWILEVSTPPGTPIQRSCQYFSNSCTGWLCSDAPPCTKDLVHMDADGSGCLGHCGSPSRCDFVASCSVCSGTCILDEHGLTHCGESVSSCLGVVTCACGADALCAGGASFCKDDNGLGISCSN